MAPPGLPIQPAAKLCSAGGATGGGAAGGTRGKSGLGAAGDSDCSCSCAGGGGGNAAGGGNGGDAKRGGGSRGGPVPDETATYPVRFSTGEIVYSSVDVVSNGFGAPWGHTRSFKSRMTVSADIGQGYNWVVAEWPHLRQLLDAGGTLTGAVLMGDPAGELYFDLVGGQYVGRWNITETLTLDSNAAIFTLIDVNGNVTRFGGLNMIASGMMIDRTDAAGVVTSVVSLAPNGGNAGEVQRSFTDAAGNTTVESLLYTYDTSFSDGINRLSSVLLRRQVNGGPWVNARQATYAYWDGSNAFGALGDLKTVSKELFESGVWSSTAIQLYRWYVVAASSSSSSSGTGNSSGSSSSSSSSSGPATYDLSHLPKYIVEADSYARLATAFGPGDPTLAPDSLVAQFADNYFQYDNQRCVTFESVEGGTRNYLYARSQSTFPAAYNAWMYKTVQTLPGGTQILTYANYAGQVMLSVRIAGAGQPGNGPWYDGFIYNQQGLIFAHLDSASITGYDATYSDLFHCQPPSSSSSSSSGTRESSDSSSSSSSSSSGLPYCSNPPLCAGNYQYIADNAGQIELYDYDLASQKVTRIRIRDGELGCDNLIYEQTITAFTASPASSSSSSSGTGNSSGSSSSGTGNSSGSSSSSSSGATPLTIYLATSFTVFPDDITVDPYQSRRITTYLGYTLFPGTLAVQSITTTWPVVSTAQNGSGVADSTTQYFDLYGNPTWRMDERGFLFRDQFDVATGAQVQQIVDVNTALTTDQPTGWTTPPGGGLHLITDTTIDPLGRSLFIMAPWITIDVASVATMVRPTQMFMYFDSLLENWTAQGYATGTAPNYAYTLINPVSITFTDEVGHTLQEAEAIRSYTNGPLLVTDSFLQSSYCRLTTYQWTDCCKLASTRKYFLIPATGTGTLGVNYWETDFGYDMLNRQNREVPPGGTIRRTVRDARDLVVSTWVGTNDAGATWLDPTGGGAPGNNMVVVTENEYDNGMAGGDGNMTQLTQHVDSSTARVTVFNFDWRNRQIVIDGEVDLYAEKTIDNMDRQLQVDRRNTTATGNLIARNETNWDDRSRKFQSIVVGVNPTTGLTTNSLVGNFWFDPSGNPIKSLLSGSQLFAKSFFDGAGRQTTSYRGYDLTPETYAQVSSVADDTIMQQVESTLDAAGNVIQSTTRRRFHNATGTGDLTSPAGPQPYARVSYVAMYPDAMGRQQATANYGTNGDVSLVRPASISARADTVLVNSALYNSRGETYQTVDPAGTVTCQTFDDAARRTELISNCQVGSSSSSSSSSNSSSSSSSTNSYGTPPSDDKNRTILWAYNGDDLVVMITAVNAETGNQVTTNVYGTTLATSDVARNDLLAQLIYPDGGVVSQLYNRLGEVKQATDQRGVTHAFDRDLLGRQVDDRVIATEPSSSSSGSSSSGGVPSGVDTTVLRIELSYEVRGMVAGVTSYDNPTVGLGNVVNDVERVFNDFSQVTTEYQEHNGAVNTSTSPNAQYQYADGSANTIRATGMTYPNGRVLNFGYGTSGGTDDALSRIASLIDDDGVTHLADYTRIGVDGIVQATYPQPNIRYDLINGSGADPYSGLDQFDRVVDCRWWNITTTDIERVKHTYDRADNRVTRENTVAKAQSPAVNQDEFYTYNEMYELARLDRGQLNAGKTAIQAGTLDFAQAWGLDATGNWANFDQDTSGAGTFDLVQTRTHSEFNEIDSISGGGWVQPAYDLAGNMVTMPQPAAPTTIYTGVYDAWNRLVSLWAGGSPIGDYRFDGLNRRVSKLVASVLRDIFYTSSWQAIEERVGGSTTPDRQFVWGLRYIDDLVLRDRGTERLFGIQDPNWNLTALCDATGAIQERYRYAAYGLPTVLTPTFVIRGVSSFDWETLFAGYHWDGESAMSYVRRRWLHPLIGRWITSDPMRKRQGNRYLYADGRPVAFLDPYGGVARKVAVKAEPIPGCMFEICCGKIIFRGKIQKCEYGDNPSNKTPCHCFVRVTEGKDKTEYHGNGEFALRTDCKYNMQLKCANKPIGFTLRDVKCKKEELIPKADYKDCEGLKKCLQGRVDACNIGTGTKEQPKPRCYNPECGANNSNTAAYDFVKNCADSVPNVADLPTKAAGCDSEPGAPGWGGWK
ncbi:MAG TPA: RHS repeat-associated core domain-containing protein [Pirellulales bacterium]|nr:RHS repeat-associated core domain-containing protein [Pirellulales bacterium]